MKTKTGVILAVLPLAMSLTGCGGGGGGSSSATLGGFTSWPNFTSGSISLTGQAQETNEVYGDLHNDIYSSPSLAADVTYNQTKDSSGQTIALTVETRSGTKDLNATDSTRLIAIDPSVYGYDYQTYGIWSYVNEALLSNLGVFSVGSVTQSVAMPTSGAASYTGMLGGHLLNTERSNRLGISTSLVSRYGFLSDLSVLADFSARSLRVITSNSIIDPAPGLLLDAATNNVNSRP